MAYLESEGIGEYWGSPLTLSERDPHPSPLSHEMAARELMGTILHRLEAPATRR